MKYAVLILALVLGGLGIVTAQSGPPISPYLVRMDGIVMAEGLRDEIDNVRWGASLTADVNGKRDKSTITGHFTHTFNYSSMEPDLLYGNKVTGGCWNLALYEDGVYLGTVFGAVREGTIFWKGEKEPEAGNMEVELSVKGATGKLAGTITENNNAHFQGYLDMTTKFMPSFTGSLWFDF